MTVFVGLGSNLGERAANLRKALVLLRGSGHFRVGKTSSFYETEPVGPPQPLFLNGAAEGKTDLSAEAFLTLLKETEKAAGRKQTERWGPREIDLDLLFYGDSVLSTDELTVPHPRMQEREFVLTPLAEIAPEFRHPRLHKTNLELLERLYFHGDPQKPLSDAVLESVGPSPGRDDRFRPDDGGAS